MLGVVRPSPRCARNGVPYRRAPALATLVVGLCGCAVLPASPAGVPAGPADDWRLADTPGCAGPGAGGWNAASHVLAARSQVRCLDASEVAVASTGTPAAPRPPADCTGPSPCAPGAAIPTSHETARHARARAPASPAEASTEGRGGWPAGPAPRAARNHGRPRAERANPPAPGAESHRRTAGPGRGASARFLAPDEALTLSFDACLRTLDRAGVAVERAADAPSAVAQPVRIAGPVEGVAIRLAWSKDPAHDIHAIFDCRLVVALRPVAALVAAAGYDTLEYVSATRRGGRPKSLHRKGLAVDLVAVRRGGLRANVAATYHRGTVPRCRRGRRPRDVFGAVVCRAWRGRWFHTILGPDHDRAHRDHLHLDLAPHRTPPRTPYVGLAGASAGDLPSPPLSGRPRRGR